MKDKENKYKITPDVRKQIKQLSKALPQIPFLLKTQEGGLTYQQTMFSRLVNKNSNTDILNELKENASKSGSEFDSTKSYIVNEKKLRLVNHEVELNQKFSLYGQLGIDSYVKYVEMIDRVIRGKNEDVVTDSIDREEVSIESTNNTTDEEAK